METYTIAPRHLRFAIKLACAVVLALFDGASGAMFIAMLGTLTAMGIGTLAPYHQGLRPAALHTLIE